MTFFEANRQAPLIRRGGYAIWTLFLSIVGVVLCVYAGYGQVQMKSLDNPPSQVLEPGANDPMDAGPPTDLGDGAVVFKFQIEDIDPLANDPNDVTISCFLVQNIGTATDAEVTDVMILDGAGEAIAPPVATAAPSSATEPDCPAGAPIGGAVSFEAFIKPAGGVDIDDDTTATFQIAVITAATGTLLAAAQNKTILLQVTIQFTESIGSPPNPTTFTSTTTDSITDYVFNGGINSLQALSFTPSPIRIGDRGVVARFEVCDQHPKTHQDANTHNLRDANTHNLRLDELKLVQGPLGSAVLEDFTSFSLWMISGSPVKWGEITAADAGWVPNDFNRGGAGIVLTVDPGFAIPDDSCMNFEIRAATAAGAMKGRTVHLRITFSAEEPLGIDIDPSVDITLQVGTAIMLGSGVLRIPDLQIAGSLVPIEVVSFPEPGFGSIQTGSIQFDPYVIHVEDVQPIEPYQVRYKDWDNRVGLLKLTLSINRAQTSSAEMGIPAPKPVAYIKVSRQGQPGQRSPLILQAEHVRDASGKDITSQVMIVSGSITLLYPGDVDLLDGIPTVRDALLLAKALLTCFDTPPVVSGLTDEQKIIADVAEPKAQPGTIPDCSTGTQPASAALDSADVVAIARMALGLEVSASQLGVRQSPPGPLRWLLSLLGLARPLEPQAQVRLVLTPDSSRLILQIDSNSRALGGLQGCIRFVPGAMEIKALRGLSDYEVLAFEIDNAQGEACFVVLAPPGRGSQARDVLEFAVEGDASEGTPYLNIELLIDPHGRPIPYVLPDINVKTPLEVRAVRLYQIDNTTWQIQVSGQGIASVRVEGFDLAGRRIFTAKGAGTSLHFEALDAWGRPLANGVYLCVVSVRGLSGQTWKSAVYKLIILR